MFSIAAGLTAQSSTGGAAAGTAIGVAGIFLAIGIGLWLVACPIVGGLITSRNGRGAAPGVVLGFFCGIPGILIALVMGRAAHQQVIVNVPGTAATPSGWYPDPWAAGSLRWWDGGTWGGQTQ